MPASAACVRRQRGLPSSGSPFKYSTPSSPVSSRRFPSSIVSPVSRSVRTRSFPFSEINVAFSCSNPAKPSVFKRTRILPVKGSSSGSGSSVPDSRAPGASSVSLLSENSISVLSAAPPYFRLSITPKIRIPMVRIPSFIFRSSFPSIRIFPPSAKEKTAVSDCPYLSCKPKVPFPRF